MFDCSRIDFIDPAFLNQYFDPTKDGTAAFPQATDEDKEVLYNGHKYTIRFSLSGGLEKLWDDFSYDLAGRWSKYLGPDYPGRLLPTFSIRFRSALKERGANALIRRAKRELERYTRLVNREDYVRMCDRFGASRVDEGWLMQDENSTIPSLSPTGELVGELTHNQVRQQILVLIAMIMRLKQPDGLAAFMHHAIYTKDGCSFYTGRNVYIARPDLYPYKLYLRGKALSSTVMEISLSFSALDMEKSTLAETTDLFSFPLLSAPAEKLDWIREKRVIPFAGREYTVECIIRNNTKERMERESLRKALDIADRVKSAFWWESPQIAALSPAEAAAIPYNYTPLWACHSLNADEKAARVKAFCAACLAAATLEGMTLILQAIPKNEDGSLIELKNLHIATLQMVTDDKVSRELRAWAVSAFELRIDMRDLAYSLDYESRMRCTKNTDPFCTPDLIDASEAYRSLCRQCAGQSAAK